MKKILSIVMIVMFSFIFIGSVNAEELVLSDIASLTTEIGGADKEITLLDTDNSYKFYYKYVAIDSNDFQNYVSARYVVENAESLSVEYEDAVSTVSTYAETFKNLIPSVISTDLESWNLVTDGEITLSDLSYQDGLHNGYVLAVAAIKDGDTNVYIDRLILESTSNTTLGNITFTDSDIEMYSSSDTVTTDSNPNTGFSDYIIYLVPASIVLGSVLLFRRSYC